MSKIDISGRVVLDYIGQELKPGDLVMVADSSYNNATIHMGVFYNSFDNGSGWKARVRIPYDNPAKSPNLFKLSWGSTNWIGHTNKSDSKIICKSLYKLNNKLSNKKYNEVVKLRDYMIEKKKIRVASIEPEMFDHSKMPDEDDNLEDIFSKLGAPTIR